MKFTPHTPVETAEMLAVIGVESIDELFGTIPREHWVVGDLDLPAPKSEPEVLRYMKALAELNATTDGVLSFLGAGAYDHYIPAAIPHLLDRGEFLTAYTPYQPEVSQGTLQAQFEFQTMVARLLGMDVANASMYEGATALAEACLMACRYTRRTGILVSSAVHPEYRRVLETYAGPENVTEVQIDETGATDLAALDGACSGDVGCVVVQSPNFFGVVEDTGAAVNAAHANGALAVATFTEPLAF
ncbi:MAG: aminotransferase class I/II-fold pyridoxal phosphate-dependent enzyme, partial [Deltaproteobacteria bacterium]|nr:aminotransferase class I/II-fold pyridoxal phosphate-dependent enzyme [Deltaproteobacteria bacterium]